MDYRALGLKCGLEVHRQLATHERTARACEVLGAPK